GMRVYDGLYSWANHLYEKKHTQAGPAEQKLLEIFTRYLQNEKGKKAPTWAKELKEMIQDQIDTNMNVNLSLQQVSDELEINPAYLSREFSKYFDNLSFGDYIRKMRIDKAMLLIETTAYTLTEVAYITGFSDQSHFNRIFKKHTGQNPSVFKKKCAKK
ncbi:MAG: helix-turn-helix transcriptional regulator, partial [Bacteroidota bacterium]